MVPLKQRSNVEVECRHGVPIENLRGREGGFQNTFKCVQGGIDPAVTEEASAVTLRRHNDRPSGAAIPSRARLYVVTCEYRAAHPISSLLSTRR